MAGPGKNIGEEHRYDKIYHLDNLCVDPAYPHYAARKIDDMLSPEWQDLLKQFEEAYEKHPNECFWLRAVRGSQKLLTEDRPPPMTFLNDVNICSYVGFVEIVDHHFPRIPLVWSLMGDLPAQASESIRNLGPDLAEMEYDNLGLLMPEWHDTRRAFLALARIGGKLLSERHLEVMQVSGTHEPEALWAQFLWYRSSEGPSNLSSRHHKWMAESMDIRNPFFHSILAINSGQDTLKQTDADIQHGLVSEDYVEFNRYAWNPGGSGRGSSLVLWHEKYTQRNPATLSELRGLVEDRQDLLESIKKDGDDYPIEIASTFYSQACGFALHIYEAAPSLPAPPERVSDPDIGLDNLLRWCMVAIGSNSHANSVGMDKEERTGSGKGGSPTAGIPRNLAELQAKIAETEGDDRWNMICLVVETGREAAPDSSGVMRAYRPCCCAVCKITSKDLKNAENRLRRERSRRFTEQYTIFKTADVAMAVARIVKPELDERIASLHASKKKG